MIGFAGLSHLGVVSTIAAAVKGCRVVAFDPHLPESPAFPWGDVYEPGLAECWSAHGSHICLTRSPEALRDCPLIVLSLDTATDAQGRSDLAAFDDLFHTVVAVSAPGSTLVILSQLAPGATRQRLTTLSDKRRHLYYQVETLILGRALERALQPERIIVGCENPDLPLPPVYRDYLARFACPVLRLTYESAELSKIAINTFLASSVSTTNLLAELCEALGADWSQVAETLKLDRRIGPHAYLSPGLGFAGGNLERDLASLKEMSGRCGTDSRLVDTWLAGSRYRRDWVLRHVHANMPPGLDVPTIAVWGLAYKADTSSTTNSPAVSLIEALNFFRIAAYDPRAALVAGSDTFRQVSSAIDACRGADLLAIMTPWNEFATIPIAQIKTAMRGRTIIDPFHVLDSAECAFHGMKQIVLGKASRVTEVVA